MSVKINTLELENVKRIKAVKIEPAKNGLTVIGGKNNQGKTSVLDSIAWALGGNKYKPSNPERTGSNIPPHLKIVLDNGMIVERCGKNGSLKVTDPAGNKSGQQLLDSFIEQLALDLPKFMAMSSKEKANVLLKIIGIGDRLYELEQSEQKFYNQRVVVGRMADQKKKYANELPFYNNIPNEPVSAGELIRQQQDILQKNAENQMKRNNLAKLEDTANELQNQINALSRQLTKTLADLETARKDTAFLKDESTAELEENIRNIDELNQKIRANLEREKAELDAEAYIKQYEELTENIESIREDKAELLETADMPLPELSVKDGELTYNGYSWDNMSGSEQLKAATAIVRKLNPKCGFVLLDKLEQMDTDTLNEFGQWLEKEGLQAIATRVSVGNECSVIIEDGYVKEESAPPKKWTAGQF